VLLTFKTKCITRLICKFKPRVKLLINRCKWDQDSQISPLTALIKLPTETIAFSKNIRNIQIISSPDPLSAEMDHKQLRQFCHKWHNRTHFNNNKSFQAVDLNILEFCNSLKIKVGCQNHALKEVKIWKWDRQVDMNRTTVWLNSKCVKVTTINRLIINNHFISILVLQIYLIYLTPTNKCLCTILTSSSNSNINSRCLSLCWIRLLAF
jgi:hypothetical protein